MAEEAKPVVESTPEVKPVVSSTTTTVEQKKSGSALPKILIILVVVICACVVCAVAAYFVFVTFLSKATSSLNSAIVNEVMNSTYNSSTGSTTPSNGTSNSTSTDTNSNFTWGTSIPSTFPSDIPIYEGAESSFSSSEKNTDGKQETSVTFALKGNAADVVNFYKTQMVKAGYSLESEANFFGSVLSFTNTQREVIVSVIGSEDSQDVVLSLIVTDK